MDSITQNNENENKNTKRYLPHDVNTKYHAVLIIFRIYVKIQMIN